MSITYHDDLSKIDWAQLKSALAADHFDNGRTPEQLRQSFENSHSVCIAWSEERLVGTARVLSDGVCNAYLVDVWTLSNFRRQGIAREMIRRLCEGLPGQHFYLQADEDQVELYRKLGFREHPHGMGKVVGEWLANESRWGAS